MRSTARLGAYVASAALVLTGVTLTGSPAQGVTYDPAPEQQGASWLAGELTGGILGGDCSYDCGTTIDVGLALLEAGGQSGALDDMRGALPGKVEGYITGEAFGDTGSTYAGATAKSLAFATDAGLDPTSYGGVNLVSRLEAQVTGSGPSTGRLYDTSNFGDYANTLGQAFAARGLASASSLQAVPVRDFLLQQQCQSGYFRLDLTADKTAADQSCVEGTDTPDTDITALVMIELAPQAANPVVASALTKARSWLVGQQRCDGSFGGGTSTEGSNANSTGLVAWALGDSAPSRQAAQWLRAHQATAADSGNGLAGETGAIGYDDPTLSAGRTNGITSSTRDKWHRSTSQALPGLAWYSTDATPALALTGPSDYRKAGTTVTLATSGAQAGSVLCLTGTGTSARTVSDGSTWNRGVVLPPGTASRTYTARDAYGHRALRAVNVLGAKALEVATTRHRVHRRHIVTATARGLAPDERAAIYYKGSLVRRGVASSTGVFTATFRVGRRTGIKRIVAIGQFADIRRGATTIKVVR